MIQEAIDKLPALGRFAAPCEIARSWSASLDASPEAFPIAGLARRASATDIVREVSWRPRQQLQSTGIYLPLNLEVSLHSNRVRH